MMEQSTASNFDAYSSPMVWCVTFCGIPSKGFLLVIFCLVNFNRIFGGIVSKLLSMIVLAIALLTIHIHPALAEASSDVLTQGAKVFSANCAACHMGGSNVVAANKNLKADTLKQFGMDSEAAIIAQVTNGKSAMPPFKGRLKEDQIQAVAAYVLAQSAQGWK
jgi:cytochrome c6